MYQALRRFLDAGGSLLYLGGNALYARVTLEGDKMELHRNGQYHEQTGEPGGFWTLLGESPAQLVGNEYDARGYDTFASHRVVRPQHWIFEGTGLKEGSLFGAGKEGSAAASGHETDKISVFSPPKAQVVAVGTNPDSGGANLLVFATPADGLVVSAGSISFAAGLNTDPVLSPHRPEWFEFRFEALAILEAGVEHPREVAHLLFAALRISYKLNTRVRLGRA